jgi:hypothetical protein
MVKCSSLVPGADHAINAYRTVSSDSKHGGLSHGYLTEPHLEHRGVGLAGNAEQLMVKIP